MKISETTSYPHPVLTSWSDDITGATFSAELTFREHGDAQLVDMFCEFSLDQPDLIELIRSGRAAAGCFITCVSTGLRRMQRLGFPSGSHQFAPGALLGRVQLRPMVWALQSIENYDPQGAHSEFGGPVCVAPGQILALDGELVVDVLRPPIPSIESIFEIHASPEIEEAGFEIDLSGDKIDIRMGIGTYSLVQNLRQTDDTTRAVINNALFVPVVMEVLHLLMAGPDQYVHCRWFEPFRKRCELLKVDIESPDLLTDAQILLDRPFTSLSCMVEREMEDA